MSASALLCRDDSRRALVRASESLNGFDYLEVGDDQLSVTVFFLRKAPDHLDAANLHIVGGERITGIRVVSVEIVRDEDPERDDYMLVGLDRYGDFSNYRLCAVALDEQGRPTERSMPGFDPRYASLEFNFKVACGGEIDCKPAQDCSAPAAELPEINYLAKDYASFRQLIYDRLALTLPDWRERHVPDLGVTLVELLAYVGDHLSYYQDAVATEAYLDTARRRISVRRHARLVDYRLHEGCNTRAWVCLDVSQDLAVESADVFFITAFDSGDDTALLKAEDLPRTLPQPYLVYEPLLAPAKQTLHWYAAHNTIDFYTWGDAQCCLAKGATSATLLDPGIESRQLRLQVCDVLIFEEVLGPHTGNRADADPKHRHPVRLIAVEEGVDPLTGRFIVDIRWSRADALPFALCLSAVKDEDCSPLTGVSVARGNVVLVDHGETVTETLEAVPGSWHWPDCDDCGVREPTALPLRFRPRLSKPELTHVQPLPGCRQPDPCGAHDLVVAATGLADQDVHLALPWLELTETDLGACDTPATWSAQADLLNSNAGDRHFTVEIDDDAVAWLRFGDGQQGRMPKPGTRIAARYRTGNGPAGLVGAEAIKRVVFRDRLPSGATILARNPLPTQGGVAAEPVAQARLLAPHAFRQVLQRAVTCDDYAQIVMRDFAAEVQKAAATLRWTGSGYRVLVVVDTYAASADCRSLLCRIDRHLRRYRRIGHDLEVVAALQVPLALILKVCVRPGFLQSQIKASLQTMFSNRVLADGQRGFFHPDNLSFGDGVYLSRIVAAAQKVAGVAGVEVSELRRLFEAADDAIATGVLTLAPLEIARLDNDKGFPEHGLLTLNMEGGR
ncbi:putative baseplate assembly protein [Methylomonas sp. LWB]|uniref:putative baseplate assembly protein n=1 Tax=Methylomonas sp. LWB TaxID=1905845 RepID=UPI0008DA0EC6|nr:putative baseplate assembly protein [Methylomonas sp. LWB]OHX36211.1 putative baseplate assembly protein [Methylomonas sp. LWB]